MALASSAGSGPSAPKAVPSLEQIHKHIDENSELIRTITTDVQSFIGRSLGNSLGGDSAADAPSPNGLLNIISNSLSEQTRRLQELCDAVNVLPEII